MEHLGETGKKALSHYFQVLSWPSTQEGRHLGNMLLYVCMYEFRKKNVFVTKDNDYPYPNPERKPSSEDSFLTEP